MAERAARSVLPTNMHSLVRSLAAGRQASNGEKEEESLPSENTLFDGSSALFLSNYSSTYAQYF